MPGPGLDGEDREVPDWMEGWEGELHVRVSVGLVFRAMFEQAVSGAEFLNCKADSWGLVDEERETSRGTAFGWWFASRKG